MKRGIIVALVGWLGLGAASANEAERTIAKLDSWLKANRPVYYSELNPGVTDTQLDAYAKEFDLVLPDAFRALYKWRNGHPDNRTVAFVWNHRFIPLEESLALKREMDSMIDTDFEPGWWERDWLPFTRGYGGDMEVVVANGTAQGGNIIGFYNDDDQRNSFSVSMQHWLDTLVSSMENGTYEVDGKTFTSEADEE